MKTVDLMDADEKLDLITRYVRKRFPDKNIEKLKFEKYYNRFIVEDANDFYSIEKALLYLGIESREIGGTTKDSCLSRWLKSNNLGVTSCEEAMLWLEIAGI